MSAWETKFITVFNELLDGEDPYDYSLLKCSGLRTKKSWEEKIMKVAKCDWTKYNFKKAYQYLQDHGLSEGKLSLDFEWMKILVHTQIYGGVGTIDDMLSYAGYNVERVLPSRKYRLVNFLQYYHIIEQVKRERKGGRVFEITKFGEDLIDWAAKN